MVYQEDLRERETRAIWVGDLRHEDALLTYLDEPKKTSARPMTRNSDFTRE